MFNRWAFVGQCSLKFDYKIMNWEPWGQLCKFAKQVKKHCFTISRDDDRNHSFWYKQWYFNIFFLHESFIKSFWLMQPGIRVMWTIKERPMTIILCRKWLSLRKKKMNIWQHNSNTENTTLTQHVKCNFHKPLTYDLTQT